VGMQLPSELVSVLSVLGFTWPQADEEKLFDLAQSWMGLSDRLRGSVDQANVAAEQVWAGNSGNMVTAFQNAWNAADGPSAQLTLGSTGAEIIGVGLMVCAATVLALKISVIAQLIILAIQIAQAIATAVVTFGASLLEIPIFRILAKIVLDQLLNFAIEAVLNG
jgi:hypothetical protein